MLLHYMLRNAQLQHHSEHVIVHSQQHDPNKTQPVRHALHARASMPVLGDSLLHNRLKEQCMRRHAGTTTPAASSTATYHGTVVDKGSPP